MINKNINVNETFIIEVPSESVSGCTGVYTNNIIACTGDTITISDNLSGTTLYFENYYSGNTSLSTILNSLDTFVTGGTYNNGTLTFTNNKTNQFQINGLFNQSLFDSHTGDTTIHYTKSSISLSEIGDSAHTHTIYEVVNLQSELNNKFNLSGGTINGSLSANTISATTIYGNGSNITNVRKINEDILTTSDNSTNTLSTIPFNDINKSRFIELFVTAHSDINHYGFWKRTIGINNISGVNNIVLINNDFDKQSSGLTPDNVSIESTGSNILVKISGETSITYDWISNWSIIKI